MIQTTKLTGAKELEKVLKLLGPRVAARVGGILVRAGAMVLAAAVLQDSAVAVSIALRHGVMAPELAKSMSRQPSLAWQPSAEPASVIGAALDLMEGMGRKSNG